MSQENIMERTDWLDAGFDSAQARFLMATAITHHRFSSKIWGYHQVRKLYAELAEIEIAMIRALSPTLPRRRRQTLPLLGWPALPGQLPRAREI
jgi:hypothetical protein